MFQVAMFCHEVRMACLHMNLRLLGILLACDGCDVSNRNALSRGLHGLPVSDFHTPFESEPHLSTGAMLPHDFKCLADF